MATFMELVQHWLFMSSSIGHFPVTAWHQPNKELFPPRDLFSLSIIHHSAFWFLNHKEPIFVRRPEVRPPADPDAGLCGGSVLEAAQGGPRDPLASSRPLPSLALAPSGRFALPAKKNGGIATMRSGINIDPSSLPAKWSVRRS